MQSHLTLSHRFRVRIEASEYFPQSHVSSPGARRMRYLSANERINFYTERQNVETGTNCVSKSGITRSKQPHKHPRPHHVRIIARHPYPDCCNCLSGRPQRIHSADRDSLLRKGGTWTALRRKIARNPQPVCHKIALSADSRGTINIASGPSDSRRKGRDINRKGKPEARIQTAANSLSGSPQRIHRAV